MRIPITVPEQAYPKKDPGNPCPCQFRPMKLKNKEGTVTWLKQMQDTVKAGEIVCEGEVEKKALEFAAPCSGRLAEICISDEDTFTYGDILGYIEPAETGEAARSGETAAANEAEGAVGSGGMKDHIDLYLISGFLGSGKTTFLQHLLTDYQDQKVGVIVNEFGDIGIDGRLVERNGIRLVEINHGSIFCSCLKGGFVKTLIGFSREDIDLLVIENSGMADPSNMHRLLGELEGRTGRPYVYRGAICILDAVTFLKHVKVLNPVRSQVNSSSLLVVNKTDMVNQDSLRDIREKLKELNPDAYIYETVYALVPPQVLEEFVRDNGYDNETSNHENGEFTACAMECREPVPAQALEAFAGRIGERALRLKGLVHTLEGWYQLDGVDGRVSVQKASLGRRDTIRYTRVVMICSGDGVPGAEMLAAWKACTGEEGILYE